MKKPNQRLIDAVFNYCNFHSKKLSAHYVHAVSKHPYFCDILFIPERSQTDGGAERHLDGVRRLIRQQKKSGELDFLHVADCKVAEMFAAYTKGDNAAAVEECYGIIAVLLRAIDVIEGRQALGRSKKGRKGGAR